MTCTEELKFWQETIRYEHGDGKLRFEDVQSRGNEKKFQESWDKFMEFFGYVRNQKK